MQENLEFHRQMKLWFPNKAFVAGYGSQNWATNDSDLDCLPGDAEFQKLAGRSEGSALK